MEPREPTNSDRTAQSKTRYAEIKTKLENNRLVVGILLVVTFIGGATTVVKNIDSIISYFSEPVVAIETATKNLADASPEVRIIGAHNLAKIGVKNKAGAEQALSVLVTFLQRERSANKVRQPEERADVVAALQALGKIVEAADKQNWLSERPRLEKLDFSDLDLSGLYLHKVTIVDTSFERGVLNNANLSEAELINVKFNRVQAQEISLHNAQIRSSCFEEANLTNGDLRSLKVSSSDLNSSVLTGANLSQAQLNNTRVANADFGNSDLSAANFSGALEIVPGQLEKARNHEGINPLPFQRSTLSVCKPYRSGAEQ